jgi:hypothetical protein
MSGRGWRAVKAHAPRHRTDLGMLKVPTDCLGDSRVGRFRGSLAIQMEVHKCSQTHRNHQCCVVATQGSLKYCRASMLDIEDVEIPE